MRERTLYLAIVLAIAAPVAAQSAAPSSPQVVTAEDGKNAIKEIGRAAVERVLQAQQEAWNRHDLDGFMAGYFDSPALTFFSGANQTSGWQATLDRYKAKYASPGHEMGTLEFSDLRIEMLGYDAAFVRGAWQLTLSDGKKPHGLFTLIFRSTISGWKIVHDHTSAAE